MVSTVFIHMHIYTLYWDTRWTERGGGVFSLWLPVQEWSSWPSQLPGNKDAFGHDVSVLTATLEGLLNGKLLWQEGGVSRAHEQKNIHYICSYGYIHTCIQWYPVNKAILSTPVSVCNDTATRPEVAIVTWHGWQYSSCSGVSSISHWLLAPQ